MAFVWLFLAFLTATQNTVALPGPSSRLRAFLQQPQQIQEIWSAVRTRFAAPTESPKLHRFVAALTADLAAVDKTLFKGNFQQQIFEPVEEQFNVVSQTLFEPINNDSRTEVLRACDSCNRLSVLTKLLSLLNHDWLLHHSAAAFHSTKALSSLIKTIDSCVEKLIVSEGFCADLRQETAEDTDAAKAEEWQEAIGNIYKAIEVARARIDEVYFPKMAYLVAVKALSQMSSESYSFYPTEIKNYNEEVGRTLVKTLNEQYANRSKFAVALNRANNSIVGKFDAASTFPLQFNGWSGFVFRTSVTTSISAMSTNIPDILESFQDSSTENSLCEDSNEETLKNIFAAIRGVCEKFDLCVLWPFGNAAGVATDSNLVEERYSLCGRPDFQGFTVYFGVDGQAELEESVGAQSLWPQVETTVNESSLAAEEQNAALKPSYDLNYNPGMASIPLPMEKPLPPPATQTTAAAAMDEPLVILDTGADKLNALNNGATTRTVVWAQPPNHRRLVDVGNAAPTVNMIISCIFFIAQNVCLRFLGGE